MANAVVILDVVVFRILQYKVENQQAAVAVAVLLFYVHGKHLRSCRDGQLT